MATVAITAPDPDPYEMTPERCALALTLCEGGMALGDIAKQIFGEKDPVTGAVTDGRTQGAKVIRAFLAGEGKTAGTTAKEPVDPDIALSDDQKQQIEKLAPKMREGGSVELARIIWGDSSLQSLHRKTRLVREYMKQVYSEGVTINDEPVDEREWKPPISISHLIGLVNTYVQQADNRKTYNGNNLKPSERKCLEAMMIYLRNYKVSVAASKFERKVDRELFLSTFIGWTHDKPDLTRIEQDQFVMCAEETVNIVQIDRSIQRIDKMQEEVTMGQVVDEHGKKAKLSMTDVELINAVRTKHDAAKKRLLDIMSHLEGARAEREQARKNRNFSVQDLLDAWMQNRELTAGQGPFRDKLLQGGIDEKDKDTAEVERLSAEEEIVALISGQSKEEARS